MCLCFPRFRPRFQFSTPKMKLICPVNCSRGSGGQWRKCFSPAYLGRIEHVLKRFSITHVLTVQCFTFCSTWSRQSCGMGSHIHASPTFSQEHWSLEQLHPCCPTWSCGFWFDIPELQRWQGLVVFQFTSVSSNGCDAKNRVLERREMKIQRKLLASHSADSELFDILPFLRFACFKATLIGKMLECQIETTP